MLELRKRGDEINKVPRIAVHNSVNCTYSRRIVILVSLDVHGVFRLSQGNGTLEKGSILTDIPTLQIGDFENLRWELIMGSGQQHGASSYLVRKGLSRKAPTSSSDSALYCQKA